MAMVSNKAVQQQRGAEKEAPISALRRTVSDLATLQESPPMTGDDLVGWPFGTEEFLDRLAAALPSPKPLSKAKQKFFSGPLHYRNGVTASGPGRSEFSPSPRRQARVADSSMEDSPVRLENADTSGGREKDREHSGASLSTASFDRFAPTGETAVSPEADTAHPPSATTHTSAANPADVQSPDEDVDSVAGIPVGITAGITLQGHGFRRSGGPLPPVPLKMRTNAPQRRKQDPGLQRLHHIINRATMELDEHGAEFAEVFAKTLAEATAVIAESPRPFSQEQVDVQRYGLPAVLERAEDSEESSQKARSPMLEHMRTPEYSLGSIGREDEERSVFTFSEVEAGGGRGGWPEPLPPLSPWKLALLAFMAGSTCVMLLVGIVLEVCSSAGVKSLPRFRQEFFFFQVLAGLVVAQALQAARNRRPVAFTNAMLVAWILDIALISELLAAVLSQGNEYSHTASVCSPFIALIFVNFFMVSVLLIAGVKWSSVSDMEAQTPKSLMQASGGKRTPISQGSKKRAWGREKDGALEGDVV